MKQFYISLLLLLATSSAFGQFYNGHQMTFGKNRVQYNEFTWQFYRFDRFDTYYYGAGRELAQYTGEYAFSKISEIESFFGYNLEKRLVFIVYNKLTDFRQSNIGLVTGKDLNNTGGVNKILDNKVFLYFDGDRQAYQRQINAAIAEVVFSEMLYGSSVKERLTGQSLSNVPEWFVNGLISYISDPWSIEVENTVKDGILSGKYRKFNRLTGDDAKYAGHSIWHFIAEFYGADVIPSIVYLTKINRNSDNVFLMVLSTSLKELGNTWEQYYKAQFEADNIGRQMPQSEKVLKRPKKETRYSEATLSRGGQFLAYTTNQLGKYKVFITDTETGKKTKILTREHKLDQIPDHSFPQLAWHPSGTMLAIVYEAKGQLWLSFYDTEEQEMQTRLLRYFEKVLDMGYSDNGLRLTFSAVRKGQSDIFVFNITSNTHLQVTNDLADDFNPRFIENSNKVIFASNRQNDTISVEASNKKMARTTDLFVYDYSSKSDVLTKITKTDYFNEFQPIETPKGTYAFLTNELGVVNRKEAAFDSTIAYIDTSIHYRYFTNDFLLSNYPRNIENHDVSGNKTTDILLNNRRYEMYVSEIPDALWGAKKSNYFSKFIRNSKARDSLAIVAESRRALLFEKRRKRALKMLESNRKTSDLIDINNYIFEKEKIEFIHSLEAAADSLNAYDDNTKFTLPRSKVYYTAFYPNYIVSQVDFGFLNETYQKYTPGSPVYFNPGMNMQFKIGTNDLFEDFKLTAGSRFSSDLSSNEVLLSFEDLRKRIDKQYIFHRQVNATTTSKGTSLKIFTHEGMYYRKYPLSQVLAFRASVSSRFDREVLRAEDNAGLRAADTTKLWVGIKGELIFDNIRDIALNIQNGSRYKVFGEFYKQVNGIRTDMLVVGADFRNYMPIHRNLIWANRFAASSSFGQSRLIYYLGAVDNFTFMYHTDPSKSILEGTQIFDKSNQPSPDYNFVYQTVATNLRGFPQNIRNGTTFAVINSELRWPIVRYFANRPINNDFFNNFQIVGFADVGSAWSGLHPKSPQNAYNTKIVNRGNIRLVVDRELSSLVAGYGVGIRSRLLGYFFRLDYAKGVDSGAVLDGVFYLSLNLDF